MTVSPHMVPGHGLTAQIEGLSRLGIDTKALIAALGPDCHPDRLKDPQSLIPVQRFAQMWAFAHAVNPREDLATALVFAIPFGAFGILDYLIGSSTDVRSALSSVSAHFRLATYEATLEVDAVDTEVWITLRPAAPIPDDASEFMLMCIARRLSLLTDRAVAPTRVCLTRPQPKAKGCYSQWFDCPVEFAAPVTRFAIASRDMDVAMSRADATLQGMLTQLASNLHLGAPQSSTLELALRARLRDAFADRKASQPHLARLLGMSERTLQRRLEQERQTFAAIVEAFRREEALRLLQRKTASVADVALALGYEEQSSFTRAFRRWTGTTPAAWRRDGVSA
jgi:AraC-like DNA-binding protein